LGSQHDLSVSRKKVHVSKILPPPWAFFLLGAAWRLAPSHQLDGTPDPPAVTSVSAPNTRSLIFAHGGVGSGSGVRSILGQVSPKRAGDQGGLGSSRFLAGLQSAAPAGAGGARRSTAHGRQKHASKGWHGSNVEATAVPLRCYCGALTSRRAQVGCVAGRTAPPRSLRRCCVGGIWPFSDLTIGAYQLALVLVPCQAPEPALTNLRPLEHGSMARTGAPGAPRDRRVGGFGIWEQNCGLWQLTITRSEVGRSMRVRAEDLDFFSQ
jgi:hypothetical protein